jgi:3-oxoadipate enol-lactonase
VDALAIDAAVIGGLSMGGYVTFALFRQSPSLFSGMILADTRSQADTPQGIEGRVHLKQVLARDGVGAVATEMLPKLLAPGTASAQPDLVARVRAMIESNPPRAVEAAIDALMTRPDSTPDLAGISCPTLVLVGNEDLVTPIADADAMQRAIERSVLVTLPAAGHLSNLEQPDAFSRALADFLLAHLYDPRGFAPRTPQHALSLAASPARSVRVARVAALARAAGRRPSDSRDALSRSVRVIAPAPRARRAAI